MDICYDVYLHPLTRTIIPADQPLPTDAIRQDAKKGDEGARQAKGGASRKGEPSHAPPHTSPHTSPPPAPQAPTSATLANAPSLLATAFVVS